MLSLVSMAWRNLLRHRRRSLLTAMAMAIAVAVVSATMVFIEGMYGQMREVVVDQSLGHVQIHHPDYPGRRSMHDALEGVESRVGEIEAMAGVVHVAPRLFGHGLVGASTRTEGAQLLGIDPQREARLRDLDRRVVRGRWLDPASSGQAVLGEDLARRLGCGLGEEVVVVTQAADGSLGNDLYEVVGLVRTGIPQFDRGAVFLVREDLGRLLALEDRAHEVVVVGSGQDATAVTALQGGVLALLDDEEVLVRTWWEVDPTSQQLFAMQGFTSWLLILFFFGVSAVGVINTLLMSVLERTRELGVMKALGMRPRGIVALVIAEALLLSVLSVLLGLVGAVGLNTYLVQQGIDFSVQGQGFELGNVSFDPVIHGRWTAAAIWQPVVGVLFFGVLAAIWPAMRASRLQPVDALREG